MSMLKYKQILTQFKKINLDQNQFISKLKMKQAVNQLYQGACFDNQLFQELWVQATLHKSYYQTNLHDFISTILQAERLLLNNIILTKKNIKIIQKEIQHLQKDNNQTLKLGKCLAKIREEEQYLHQHQNDLKIIRLAFESAHQRAIRHTSQQQNHSMLYLVFILKSIFIGMIITLLLYFFVLIVKTDFLNLLYIMAILSIYILNYFDRYYIRLLLIFTIVSIIIDIMWLVLYCNSWWDTPEISELNLKQASFYKYCIVLTIFLLICKLPLGIIFFSLWNVNNQEKQVLIIFDKITIVLGGYQKHSPISNQLRKIFAVHSQI